MPNFSKILKIKGSLDTYCFISNFIHSKNNFDKIFWYLFVFSKIFNPVIPILTRNNRKISDSSTLSKVLKQSGIGAEILISSVIVGFLIAFHGFYGLVAGVSVVVPMFFGMVKSKSISDENSMENQKLVNF